MIPPMSGIAITDATEADLAQVAEINAWYVEHTVATFETTPRPLESWQQKLADGDPFLVASEGPLVLGYAYSGQFRERAAYHLSHETTVYLRPGGYGRTGLGTQLYTALLDRLRDRGLHTALALVALPNEASVRLHLRCGFVHAGTIREVGDKHGRLIDVGMYQAML